MAGTFHVPSLFGFRLVNSYAIRTGGVRTRHRTRSVPATLSNSPFPEKRARPVEMKNFACLTCEVVPVGLLVMLDTLKELLGHQYEASLSMLNLSVVRCPDASWDQPVAKWKFCQAAFHVVFFADVYLQSSDDVEAFKGQAFHVEHREAFRDYEEMEDRPQVLLYDKPFVLSYLQQVRRKAQETIARESAEALAGPSGFRRRKCSRAELHVYNIRHIQHHAAQLSLRLRLDGEVDVPWVGHGWKEA